MAGLAERGISRTVDAASAGRPRGKLVAPAGTDSLARNWPITSPREPTVALHKQVDVSQQDREVDINPVYVQEKGLEIPRFRLPDHGLLPRTAAQVVQDELILDGNARLNLATFVTTWMEPEATQLMAACFDKNLIDKDEYPQTAELERRCVSILADLWHSPAGGDATGCSTTGSSEACMLGGMALLWRWRKACRAAGQDASAPNLVMGTNVQVCWEKFCRYWEVEARTVPMERDGCTFAAEAAAQCDENTIGVVAIVGSTMDGSYEPVKEISDALDRLQQAKGHDVPIHVDGASGGFVAPFLQPFLEWDFRVPRVASINASGHKYGLVYPGVGWVVWREPAALPEDLVFKVNYLGGQMPTFALNFSRPGSNVIAQYYNFLRLGFRGYRNSSRRARTSPSTWRQGSPRSARSNCSARATSFRSSRSSSGTASPGTRSSTSPSACGGAAGWCRPTPSPPTCRRPRCCGSWSGTASAWTWPVPC